MNKNEKLFYACKAGNLLEAKRLLNRRFLRPNVNVIVDGQAPLYVASSAGYKDIVELLIAKGAALNIGHTYTPLITASLHGHKDIVELLITKGADINRDEFFSGCTPLFYVSSLGNKDIAKLLIDNKANVNVKNTQGYTPLTTVSIKGFKDIAELLIAKGADVNTKDYFGDTPLFWASKFGQKDIAELLIAKGADVNAKNFDGYTPLIKASMNGQKELAELLIAKGGDVFAKNNGGKSALNYASEKGYKEITELLIEKSVAILRDYIIKNELISKPSQDATKFIYEALRIIESLIQIHKGWLQVDGIEFVMKAANKLKEAFKLHPDNPLIHYAYASCLHLAMQNKSAEIEMRNCVQSHPDFILAKIALEGWDKWKSMFSFPPWRTDIKTVHPYISQVVQKSTLISVRDVIVPRAAIFIRDLQDDFTDIKALESAKISIASVISPISNPQVIGIYAKIYDDPNNPVGVEILEIPFTPRGDKIRSAYEYLCIQEDVDFVIINRDDEILLNRRISIPMNMRITNNEIFKMLQVTDGIEYSTPIIVEAIMTHQQKFSISNVEF